MSLTFPTVDPTPETIPWIEVSIDRPYKNKPDLTLATLLEDRDLSPEAKVVNAQLAERLIRAILRMPPKWQAFLRAFLEGSGTWEAERIAGLCKNWWHAGGRESVVRFLRREMSL